MKWAGNIPAARRLPTNTVVALNAQTDYVIGNVGDLTGITFRYAASAGQGQVVFQFYADQTQTILLSSNGFSTNGNGPSGELVNYSIPVEGPWLVVRVFPLNPMTFDLQIWSDTVQSFQANPIGTIAHMLIFSADAVVYPVGTTTIEGAAIVPTQATFFGECTVNLTSITLFCVDSMGTRRMLSKHLFANGVNTKLVNLPPMHLQLEIINLTAGAQALSYSLAAKYGTM